MTMLMSCLCVEMKAPYCLRDIMDGIIGMKWPYIPIHNLLKFYPKDPIDNVSTLFQVMVGGGGGGFY